MTTTKGRMRFIQLPADWIFNPLLLKAPPAARLLFFSLWTIAQGQGGTTTLSFEQAQHAVPGLSKTKVWLDALVDVGLLRESSVAGVWAFCDPATWNLPSVSGRSVGVLPPDCERSVDDPQNNRFAGQRVNNSDEKPRVRAREEREKEREREPNPFGVGSVLSRSRPARDERGLPSTPVRMRRALQPGDPGFADDDEGDTMSADEAKEKIRQTILRGQENNSGSRGNSIRFSKYDPNRPITPIQSAVSKSGAAE